MILGIFIGATRIGSLDCSSRGGCRVSELQGFRDLECRLYDGWAL